MKGLAILRHAVLQIVRQPGAVLQIFGMPFFLIFLLVYVAGLQFTLSPFHSQIAILRGLMPWWTLLGVLAPSLVLGALCTLAWHRFVLLAELPRGMWPVVDRRLFWPFLWRAIVIGFLVLLAVMLASFALGLVLGFAVGVTQQQPGWIAQTIGLALMISVLTMAVRLSVNIPSAALGRHFTLGDIWNSMSGQFWTLVVVLLGLTALGYGSATLAGALNMTPFRAIGFVWTAVDLSLRSILGVSVATTLYGHFVEGRPLV
jgi:hypothetical protein